MTNYRCLVCRRYLGFSTRIGDTQCLRYDRIPISILNGHDKCRYFLRREKENNAEAKPRT